MNRQITVRRPPWPALVLAFGAIVWVTDVVSSIHSGAQSTTESRTTLDGQDPAVTQDNSVRPQGPAIDVPQEILDMLHQRQRTIERREEAMRTEETRLLALKKDIELILARQQQLAKVAQATDRNAQQKQPDADNAAKAAVDHVAKMYETMPPEEAAARLERLPTDMALQVLRSLKGKTAGVILASVRPDKAAKLTERFLAGSRATMTPSAR